MMHQQSPASGSGAGTVSEGGSGIATGGVGSIGDDGFMGDDEVIGDCGFIGGVDAGGEDPLTGEVVPGRAGQDETATSSTLDLPAIQDALLDQPAAGRSPRLRLPDAFRAAP